MSKGYFDHCMTVEQLEQEHKKLVIQMHPDRNPDNPNATADFQEMQAQYEERKAELNGDYTKSRKGRERREREANEHAERERKERERRKVEQAIEQARKNKQRSHLELKAGDYVYARSVEWMRAFSAEECCTNDVLRMAVKQGVKDETVVMIEVVFDMGDTELMDGYLSSSTDGDIYGGWDVLQKPDPANGIHKEKRVAKVVMFRSPSYCIFGNPKGDPIITDYYLPFNYETMFSDHLHRIKAGIEREKAEAARLEAERKARIEAEQKPLIEEWKDKLIGMSTALSSRERETVALSNLKTVLKDKFPGTTFKVKTNRYNETTVAWEDGPTTADVVTATDLFNIWLQHGELTPWQEHFGTVSINYGDFDRKMSVLTKARILQQLGSVTEAFSTSAINEDVTVSEFDWMMLHLLVGISIANPDAKLCMSTMHADGSRSVNVAAAVRFVFNHSSYNKQPKAKKAKAA